MNLGSSEMNKTLSSTYNAQKMKFSIKDFFSKCGFGHIY